MGFMAKPDNVQRFFFYLGVLNANKPVHYGLVADRIKLRQFYDDMSYLRELLPQADPGASLESEGEGRWKLERRHGEKALAEAEFLPFLKALAGTTNLFPYPVTGWMSHLEARYGQSDLRALNNRIHYTSTPHPDRHKPEHFHLLVQSLVNQKLVKISYKNREGVARELLMEPMTFLNHNGVWYLIGDGEFTHRPGLSDQPTQIKLQRIARCAPTDLGFRNRFDLGKVNERLRSTFGSHTILEGPQPLTVVLRFFGDAVAHVQESWFHYGQSSQRNPDGSCDLTLRVNDLFDALQLTGQWGSMVRPLSPPELVEQWKARAQEVAQWAGSD
jgi:predicted DNA-binding transcriptional regulator YafY